MMQKRFSWKQLKWLFPFFLIGLILFQSGQELKDLSLATAFTTLKQLNGWEQFSLILLGGLAVLTMTGYDYFLLRALRIQLPVRTVVQTAWITNSMNGMLGFGGVIGIAIRTSLYRPYTDTKRLLRAIGWMTPTLISGLSIMSIGVLTGLFPADALIGAKPWIWLVLLTVSALLPFYLFVTSRRSNVTWSTLIGYTMTSLAEWVTAGLVAIYALSLLDSSTSFTQLFGVFIVATVVGVVSLVPGGAGTFDLLYLIGMTQLGIDQDVVLSSLIIYRFVYFVVPFLIGLFLAAIVFGDQVVKQIEYRPIIGSSYEIGTVVWRIVSRTLSKMSRLAGSLIALTSSLIIWFQTLLPSVTPLYDTSRWSEWIGTLLLLTSGLLMSLCVYGMYVRTKRTLWLLGAAFVFATIGVFARGFNLFEALVVIGFGLFVWLTRKRHVRYRSIMTGSRLIRNGLYVTLYVGLHSLLLQSFSESDDVFFTTNQAVWLTIIMMLLASLVVATILISFDRLKRPSFGQPYETERIRHFQNTQETSSSFDLAHMADKRLYMSEDEQACLLFASARNHAIVLGDIQGEKEAATALLSRFIEDADRLGYIPLFYQITPDWMPRLHDVGFTFFKLGEEATVEVDSFSLSGKKRANARSLYNQFEKKGITFEMFMQPSIDLLEELNVISDEWIGNRHEKGFSLGFFDIQTLQRYPIAVLKRDDGTAIAFISLLRGTQTISIDLMRSRDDAPSGSIEVLILHIIEWAREHGYGHVGLGVAPLAAVGEQAFSHWPERVAADIFENISYIYPFSGLRQFKHKFKPSWEGRYLAFRQRRKLLPSLLRTARLISRRR